MATRRTPIKAEVRDSGRKRESDPARPERKRELEVIAEARAADTARVKRMSLSLIRAVHPDHNKPEFQAKAKARFIDALRETKSNVYAVEKGIYFSRSWYFKERERDPEFKAAWDEAWETVVDKLEGSMMSRAIDGFDEPVYQMGMKVGTKKVYDNKLSQFMLQKNRPSKYGDDMAPLIARVQMLEAKIAEAEAKAK